MLETLTCGSWLVYATRAETHNAVRIRNIVLFIKRDQLELTTRRLFADIVVEHMAARLDAPLRELFGKDACLVPVPGAGLTRPNTVWPALTICKSLESLGLGVAVTPVLRRATSVPKSAGSQHRPTLDQHFDSLTVQGTLNHPARIILVDDVVTSGTTLMAGARRLEAAFARVSIAGFAVARVQSTGEPEHLVEGVVERITVSGARCRREPH